MSPNAPTSELLYAFGWTCHGPGWWTHDKYGSIVKERDRKWHAYDIDGTETGVYATAKQAAFPKENEQ